MVCVPDQLPLLKFGNHEVVSYEARWLSDEITKAATKATTEAKLPPEASSFTEQPGLCREEGLRGGKHGSWCNCGNILDASI